MNFKENQFYIIVPLFSPYVLSTNGNFNNGAEVKIGDTNALDASKNNSVLISFEPVDGGFLIKNNNKYWNYTKGREIVDKALFIHLHRSKVITLQEKQDASVFNIEKVTEQGSEHYVILHPGGEGISTKDGHKKGSPLVWSKNYHKSDFHQNFYFDIIEVMSGDNKQNLFIPDPNDEYIINNKNIDQSIIPFNEKENFFIKFFGTLKESENCFKNTRYKIKLDYITPSGFPDYKFYFHRISPVENNNLFLTPFFVDNEEGGSVALAPKDNTFISGGKTFYSIIEKNGNDFTIYFLSSLDGKKYYMYNPTGKEMELATITNNKNLEQIYQIKNKKEEHFTVENKKFNLELDLKRIYEKFTDKQFHFKNKKNYLILFLILFIFLIFFYLFKL